MDIYQFMSMNVNSVSVKQRDLQSFGHWLVDQDQIISY